MVTVFWFIFLTWLAVTWVFWFSHYLSMSSARSSFFEYNKKSQSYYRDATLRYAQEYAADRRRFLRSPLWPIDAVLWLTSGARKRREQNIAILKYAEGKK